MDYRYILGNFILAGMIFFLNGVLGKVQLGHPDLFNYGSFSFGDSERADFTGNFFLKIVNPAIYMAVTVSVAQVCSMEAFARTMWLEIPLFWLLRFLFMLFRNSFVFLNKKYEFMACLVSLAFGEGIFFGILMPLLSNGESVLIPVTALRDALWYAIIAYVFKKTWDMMRASFSSDILYPEEKRRMAIKNRYACFYKRYQEIIAGDLEQNFGSCLSKAEQDEIQDLVYAIMIYEDHNRPAMIRLVEYAVKLFCPNRVMSLGIMQVRTEKPITSKKSIELAIQKIGEPYLLGQQGPGDRAISSYNPGALYYEEVSNIRNIIAEERKKELQEDPLIRT